MGQADETGLSRRMLLVGGAVILSPAVVIVIAFALIGGDGRSEAMAEADASLAIAVVDPTARCALCHGPEGHGDRRFGAPAIAGQDYAYLRSQLQAYRAGWRGSHPDDSIGRSMADHATELSDAEIDDLADRYAAMPSLPEGDPSIGYPGPGSDHYATCLACHGFDGEGNPEQHAPRLTNQHGWYLERQLRSYRDGLRGHHPDDHQGQLMRPLVSAFDDQAIRDVVAYIQTLEPKAEE